MPDETLNVSIPATEIECAMDFLGFIISEMEKGSTAMSAGHVCAPGDATPRERMEEGIMEAKKGK